MNTAQIIQFLNANLSTIIISLIMAAVLVLIIIDMVRRKGSDKCSGCSCSCCSMADKCGHK